MNVSTLRRITICFLIICLAISILINISPLVVSSYKYEGHNTVMQLYNNFKRVRVNSSFLQIPSMLSSTSLTPQKTYPGIVLQSDDDQQDMHMSVYSNNSSSQRLDGMKSFASWASGKALRLTSTRSKSNQTLIVYSIRPDLSPEEVDNIHFYVQSLKRMFSNINIGAASEEYLHVFITVGALDYRVNRAYFQSSYFNPPLGHRIQLIELEEDKKLSCQSHFLQIVKCSFSQIQWQRFSYVVALDSSHMGPFLPDYWSATRFSLWSDAYTSQFSDDVAVVGTTLSCPTIREAKLSVAMKKVPLFREGPIAFDNRVVAILNSKGFAVDRMEFTYLVLLAGYNVFAMHGQPKGHDWRRWLVREPGQCTPLTHIQQQCVWTDWKQRYPELSHLPIHDAREKFLYRNPPEGDGCHFQCNYRKYRDSYGDLHYLSVRNAAEHFIKYGSIEGRQCEMKSGIEFSLHPFETLFIPRRDSYVSIIARKHLEWAEESKKKSTVLPQLRGVSPKLIDSNSGGVLVVYAYDERDDTHKDNLLYFLEVCVLADAMESLAHVNYVIVVNGAYTVTFPELPNLHVIYRDHQCNNFGSWGVGLAERLPIHSHFFCINSEVKGPFLPMWFREHWTEVFLAHMQGDTVLVGLSVNCPDGIGRAIPHVASLLYAFDRTALDIGLSRGIFSCDETLKITLTRESDFSLATIEAGYNIASLQIGFTGFDYKNWYNLHKSTPKNGLVAGKDGFQRCIGIDLNTFHNENTYQGMVPHPLDSIFYSRSKQSTKNHIPTVVLLSDINVGSARFDMASSSKIVSSRQPQKLKIFNKCSGCLHIVILLRNLAIDGVSQIVVNMAHFMMQLGHNVTFISRTQGKMEEIILQSGASLIEWKGGAQPVLDDMIGQLHMAPDLVILNTVDWAHLISSRPDMRPSHPKIAWFVHEYPLSPNHSIPPGNFWYGIKYPVLQSDARVQSLVQQADNVIFAADKVRAIWSQYDVGHFHTFRGFVVSHVIKERAREGIQSGNILKTSLGASPSTVLISVVGEICQRKRQRMLVEALHDVGISVFGENDFMLLLIGSQSEEDSMYYNDLQAFVISSDVLRPRVKFIPFTSDALKYVAIADLHMSVSVGEAFPINILEAMVLRVPVMVTPAGGSEEAIMTPGTDGILFPPISSRHELGDNIVRLLKGRLESLKAIGENGHNTVMRLYSEETAAVRVKKLLDDIMVKPFAPKGRVCVVVRTYAGHLEDPVFSLQAMLQSLLDQTYPHWTALIARTDNKPMSGLYSLLAQLGDPRLRIIEYPGDIKFEIGFFEVTDRVISQCPSDTDWLLTTNGDNWYDPKFFEHLDLDRDIIAYDFYSRYVHILDEGVLGKGCARFFGGNSNMLCKRNQLRHWHTDLGANVLNFKRWQVEGRSFHALEQVFFPPGVENDGSADGYMMESLRRYDWSVKLVGGDDGCLFSHSPNLFHCLTKHKRAVWIEGRYECLTDRNTMKEYYHRGYMPYYASDVPQGMENFQGKCWDNRH